MKSLQGLIIALGLGIAAAVLNLAYLNSQLKGVEKIDYVGIRPEQTVLRGERLAEGKLVQVPIPSQQTGNLDRFAVRWADVQTVLGKPVARTLTGGSLLLEDDLRTPPTELALKKAPPGSDEEEGAIFVPVGMKAFVPSLIQPGDRVSFFPSSSGGPVPTLAGAPAPPVSERTDLIGPFVVLALGSRLSSDDVARAATVPASQQNILTVRTRRVKGQFDEQTERLRREIDRSSARGLDVYLHPRD